MYIVKHLMMFLFIMKIKTLIQYDSMFNKIKVNRIIHMADIHCKYDSTKNYIHRAVFKELFVQLSDLKLDANDLIVIVGDITNDFGKFTFETIDLVAELFTTLASFCPIVFCVGNHDLSKDRKDTISNLITSLRTINPIYALTENCIYLYGQIAFSHTHVESHVVVQPIKSNDYTKIAIFHGTIHGATFDNEYRPNSNRFSMKDFKGFSWCLFGDVHKYQHLNKEKTAWYSSSLVQMSRSEHPLDHGFVLLDLNKGKHEFHRVKNDYAMYDLTIKEDMTINIDLQNICKHPDIVVNIKSSDITIGDKFKKLLDKQNVEPVNFCPRLKLEPLTLKMNVDGKNVNILDVKEKNQIHKMIIEHLKTTHKIKKERMSNIQKILAKIISETHTQMDMSSKKTIELISLNVSNLLVFGKDNKIDFKELNGLIGLFEDNSKGKTSYLDLFSIIMFGKTTRSANMKEFIRSKQKIGSGELILSVNNVVYKITRIIERDSKKRGDLFTVVKNFGSKNNVLNYESDNADKIIRDEIITFDDMHLIMIIPQTRYNGFLGSENKKNIILKYAGMDYLNMMAMKCHATSIKLSKASTKKYSEIADEFKNPKYMKNKTDKYEDVKNIQTKMIEDKKKIEHDYENINREFTDLTNNFNTINSHCIRLKEKLSHMNVDDDDEIEDFDNLNLKYKICMKNISEKIKKQNTIEKNIKKYEKDILILDREIKKCGDIDSKNKQFIENKIKKIDYMTENIKVLETKKKIIDNEIVLTNEEMKMSLKGAEKILKELNDEIKNIKKKIDLFNDADLFMNYKKYIDVQNKIQRETILIDAYSEIIESLKEQGILKIMRHKISIFEKKIQSSALLKHQYESEMEDLLEYKNNYDILTTIEPLPKLLNKNDVIANKIKRIVHICNFITNATLDEKIKDIKKDIKHKQTQGYELYDKYCDLIKRKEEIENNLKDEKVEIGEIKLELEELKREREDISMKISKIEKNKQLYKDYEICKREYDKYCDDYDIIKLELDKCNTKKIVIVEKYNKMLRTFDMENQKCDMYFEMYQESKDYLIIGDMLAKNDFIDKFLEEEIIVKLQHIVNEMLEAVDLPNILIKLVKKNENKVKTSIVVLETVNTGNVMQIGHLDRGLIEVIFRIALSQINMTLTSRTLFIDEIFDGASENSREKILRLIELVKMKFVNVFIISHDSANLSIFDKRMRIDVTKDGNRIYLR